MLAFIARMVSGNHRRHIGILFSAVVICVVAGGAAFAASQHVAVTTGLYWAVTSATTVGYGDVIPHNGAGRLIAVAVMLTTIPLLAAIFALVTGTAAAAGLRRILAMGNPFPTGAYRLVVGTHPSVPTILEELRQVGDAVVWVADIDPAQAPAGVHVVRGAAGDPAAIRAARPKGARQALITGENDGDVLVSAVLLHAEAPDLEVTALVRSTSVREALHDLGIRQALALDELVAHTLAKSLETPHAGDMLIQLMDSNEHALSEIECASAELGKPLSAVRNGRAGLVLGLVQGGTLTLGIGHDPVIAVGDCLLIADPAATTRR
ncbi:MAG TPA: ion channel [Mycobacteriales bacterium]|nr:ion channel [Mycobacteriales bacterium]